MPRFPLQPLLEHSRHRMEAAERLLRLLKRKENEARSRLAELEGFRDEYQARLRQGMSSGMDIHRFRDYQAFLAQIEVAIQSQSEAVRQAHARWEQAHAQWLAQRQKVKAYEVLATRHRERELRFLERLEQKAADERAGRRDPLLNSDDELA